MGSPSFKLFTLDNTHAESALSFADVVPRGHEKGWGGGSG